MVYPSRIVVHIHDTIDVTIETGGRELNKSHAEALREKVYRIVSAPVEEALRREEGQAAIH